MKVTNIRFRDFVTFFAISGILLLTASRYVESHTCGCAVHNRTPFPADAGRDEVERWLRRVLRDHRILPAADLLPQDEENNDGSRGHLFGQLSF